MSLYLSTVACQVPFSASECPIMLSMSADEMTMMLLAWNCCRISCRML